MGMSGATLESWMFSSAVSMAGLLSNTRLRRHSVAAHGGQGNWTQASGRGEQERLAVNP
jgi:hypothetical protein